MKKLGVGREREWEEYQSTVTRSHTNVIFWWGRERWIDGKYIMLRNWLIENENTVKNRWRRSIKNEKSPHEKKKLCQIFKKKSNKKKKCLFFFLCTVYVWGVVGIGHAQKGSIFLHASRIGCSRRCGCWFFE